MNNPFQIIRAMQNPQKFFTEMMTNGQVMQDPRCRKTMELLQKHDEAGLRAMAENMCQEYGTTADQVKQQLGQYIGM